MSAATLVPSVLAGAGFAAIATLPSITTAAAVAQAAAPMALPVWEPSPELKAMTALLTAGNLHAVQDRTNGLRSLLRRTSKGEGLEVDQIRNCASIKLLPFLRMNKKLRSNPLNAEFITAGRAYNRELVQARITAGQRLDQLAEDTTVPPWIQRLASCTNARTSRQMKVEHGEMHDYEIPADLLPPDDLLDMLEHAEPAAQSAEYDPMPSGWSTPTPPTSPRTPPVTAPHQVTPRAAVNTSANVPISTPPSAALEAAKPAAHNAAITQPAPAKPAAPAAKLPSSDELLAVPGLAQAANPAPRGKPFGMPGAKRGPFKKRPR